MVVKISRFQVILQSELLEFPILRDVYSINIDFELNQTDNGFVSQ